MGVSLIQLLIYVLLIGVSVYCFCFKHKKYNRWVEFVRQHLLLMVLLLAINTLSFVLSIKGKQENYLIKRQSYGGYEKKYEFQIIGEDKDSDIDLVVAPKKLKPKEAEERMEKAFDFLNEHMKGSNVSFEKITSDLDLTLSHDEYPFDMEVIPSDYLLVNEEGVVRNEESELRENGFGDEELLSGINCSIRIVLWYGELRKERDYEFVVFPKEKSDWEKQLTTVSEMLIRKEKESEYEDSFIIPAGYNGLQIISLDKGGISPTGILIIGFLVTGLLLLRELEMKKKQEDTKRQELLYAYPWFINEMVLMLGAGMQIKNIFSMLISETKTMKTDDHRRYLIEELKMAQHGFEIGMSESRIYYELGKRLKLPCYIKIMTLLEQNVTKGSRGLVGVFEQEERNALIDRMNLAKKRGEEAGTKLLGPMILLLLIVMLMIMVPAFMSFA